MPHKPSNGHVPLNMTMSSAEVVGGGTRPLYTVADH